MIGAIVIVVVLLVIPVLVLMTGAIASALLGFALQRDVESSHAGSELLELDN